MFGWGYIRLHIYGSLGIVLFSNSVVHCNNIVVIVVAGWRRLFILIFHNDNIYIFFF